MQPGASNIHHDLAANVLSAVTTLPLVNLLWVYKGNTEEIKKLYTLISNLYNTDRDFDALDYLTILYTAAELDYPTIVIDELRGAPDSLNSFLYEVLLDIEDSLSSFILMEEGYSG